MSENKEELSKIKEELASDVASQNAVEYGQDIINRQFPHCVDGLKKIHRRALWCIRDRPEEFKANTLQGLVSAFHPHGEASIIDSIARLTQSFNTGIPLIASSSSTGEYSKPTSAQSRYVDVACSQYLKDLFFSDDLGYLKLSPSFDYTLVEPDYLVPKLPNALLLKNFTIGYGWSSYTVPIHLHDVCDLVQWYAEWMESKKNIEVDFSEVAHLLIPDFYNPGYIRNRDVLLEEYSKGNYSVPIVHEGTLFIDPAHIVIETVPDSGTYHEDADFVSLVRESKKHWLNNVCVNVGNRDNNKLVGSRFVQFKRTVNPFDHLDAIKKIVGFTRNITPSFHFVTLNSKVAKLAYPELLNIWYKHRYSAISISLKREQQRLISYKLIISALMKIRDYIDDVINIIRNTDEDKHSIKEIISNKYDLSAYQTQAILKMPISDLSKKSKSNLEEAIEKNKKLIDDVAYKHTRINEVIANDAEAFKKKYNRPRHSYFANFIGYVKIADKGIIQFRTNEEMMQIIERFNGVPCEVYHYRPKDKYFVAMQDKKLIDNDGLDLPKEMRADAILSFPTKSLYTLAFVEDTVSCVDGMWNISSDSVKQLLPVTHNFIGIHNNGKLEALDITKVSRRKTISKGSKTTLIYAIPNYYKDVVVVSMNTTEPNVVRFSRIENINSPGKDLPMVPMGETKILGVFPIKMNDVIVNLSAECLARQSVTFLRVEGLAEIFSQHQSVLIDIGKSHTIAGRRMRKHPRCRSMLVI